MSHVRTVVPGELVPFFRAVGDETRLAIVRLLALTDLRAGEIVAHLRMPQNAVSYHLKQLRAIGVLRDRRSSVDARDVYYRVDHARLTALYLAAGDVLQPGLGTDVDAREADGAAGADLPLRILFVCTHNSARSQIAEALAHRLGGRSVEAYSAGSHPTELHPVTVELLKSLGEDPARYHAKLLDQFRGQDFHYIITVCDRVREHCPTFPDDDIQIHWSFPDPTEVPGLAAQRQAFATLRREMETRLRYLLVLPHPITGRRIRPALTAQELEGGTGGASKDESLV